MSSYSSRQVNQAPPHRRRLLSTSWRLSRRGGPTPTIEGFLLLTPSPTPPYPDPIYTEQQAIDRSLDRFPEGYPPYGEVAILMPYSQLDAWRGGSSPKTQPDSPAWLVGILADGMTMFDVLLPWLGYAGLGDPNLPSSVPASAADSDWVIEGLFYAWDANGGSLIGLGVLTNPSSPMYTASSRSYESLLALPSHNMPIEPATPIPSPTPGPSPTSIGPVYPGGES